MADAHAGGRKRRRSDGDANVQQTVPLKLPHYPARVDAFIQRIKGKKLGFGRFVEVLVGTLLTDADAQDLGQALLANSKVSAIQLLNIQISLAGCRALTDVFTGDTKLTYLNIGETYIGDGGAHLFAEVLRSNTTLTDLELERNGICGSGAEALADALRNNTSLSRLSLGKNNLGETGARSLANALRLNTTLTVLDLRGNSLGAAGAESFADMLRVNGTLKQLDLSLNSVGDVGAEHVADALRVNTSLDQIDLCDNNLTGQALDIFADAMRSNTTITRITLCEGEEVPKISDVSGAELLVGSCQDEANMQIIGMLLLRNKIEPDRARREALLASDIRKLRDEGCKIEEECPASFCCPITCCIMEDPVVAKDGYTYERSAIQRWLVESDNSPQTREFMVELIGIPEMREVVLDLRPNMLLIKEIREWVDHKVRNL
eukprot:gb/GECG01000843.1/.p1 GENE.gb/GECG01000843.1/~~gb/GECG01000843.1/.p1  ORF type:complete len:434 (+),score=45.97 gb/GECG01000843.1/:1-1302(+)